MTTLPISKHKTVTPPAYVSYETYLAMVDSSCIMEWVDGEIITYMPAVYAHQDIVLFLAAILRQFASLFNLGVVIVAPFEVKLWPDGPAREPDVLFVSQANQANLTSKRYEGGPDLVIEVVSPGSVRTDRVTKFAEYEQAGVKEYWLIDPRPHQQQADFYMWEEGLFVPAGLDNNGYFRSTILPNFWLDPNWFWQTQLPDPLVKFVQIILTVPDISPTTKHAFQALHDTLKKHP